jgi:hypothetical protein
MKAVIIVIVVIVVLILMGLAGLGVLMEVGSVPDTCVVRGEKLSAMALSAIDDALHLEEGETVKFYYTDNLVSFEDGFVVTDRRIASYEAVENETVVYSCTY